MCLVKKDKKKGKVRNKMKNENISVEWSKPQNVLDVPLMSLQVMGI